MSIEKVQNILEEFSNKYELKQNATLGCLKAMNNCINDNPNGLGGFSIDEIRFEFIKQELIFEHIFYNTPFVKTRIGLYKKEENNVYVRNLEPIGYYELDTDITGDSFDDWLIINVEKNNELKIDYNLEDIGKTLPEKYLNSDSIYYEYISFVAQATTLYQSKKYRACQIFIERAFEIISKKKIKKDFESYASKSKKHMKEVVSYMNECGYIEEDILEIFKKLEIIKPKPDKL